MQSSGVFRVAISQDKISSKKQMMSSSNKNHLSMWDSSPPRCKPSGSMAKLLDSLKDMQTRIYVPTSQHFNGDGRSLNLHPSKSKYLRDCVLLKKNQGGRGNGNIERHMIRKKEGSGNPIKTKMLNQVRIC
nr:hypothetical protein Iba_chr13cCG6790 [Ipomoea batatas]